MLMSEHLRGAKAFKRVSKLTDYQSSYSNIFVFKQSTETDTIVYSQDLRGHVLKYWTFKKLVALYEASGAKMNKKENRRF